MFRSEQARRLGYYEVGNRQFNNKVDALIFASLSNLPISWHFNDDIFSSIDWSIPIEESLDEIYKKRALQLRNKYDYVSLFYSGGVDSTNILNSFVDNNIHLDEIVMYRPNKYDTMSNMLDKSGNNVYSEIKYAAIPYLEKYLSSTKTKIRIIDFETDTNNFLSSDYLISQYSNSLYNIASATISKIAFSVLDKEWRKLYDQGKRVAHIHGCDKPPIRYGVREGFWFNFRDIMSYNFVPNFSDSDSELLEKHQFHELFYWTPDVPEIVVKQCQVIKKICTEKEINKLMILDGYNGTNSDIWIAHQIYNRKVFEPRNLFSTGKTSYSYFYHPWDWVRHGLDQTKFGNVSNLINYTRNNISGEMFFDISKKDAFNILKSKDFYL